MSSPPDSDGQVTYAAARAYERLYVPALFGEWAPRTADAVRVEPGERALDVACGTGVVARELAQRLGPERVVGLDCNPGMLAVAAESGPGIDWWHAFAEAIPPTLTGFDVVTCQFGLMFFADRTAALRRCVDALRPGGRLAITVWAGLDANPGYAEIVALLEEIGAPKAAEELRAPFCLGTRDSLAAELSRAGIESFELDTIIGLGCFDSLRAWIDADIEAWTLGPHLRAGALARYHADAPARLQRFIQPSGRVTFPSTAHIVRATRAA